MKILAIDVNYIRNEAIVAGILFTNWLSHTPEKIYISRIEEVESYISGEFFRRELPCILKLLEEHEILPDFIVIDGFVYLDGDSAPGLGKVLFDSLNHEIPVIGVAKNPFKDISDEYAIYRGESTKPLYITSAGISIDLARNLMMAKLGHTGNKPKLSYKYQ